MTFLGKPLRVVIEHLGREQTNGAQRLKCWALNRPGLPRINTPDMLEVTDLQAQRSVGSQHSPMAEAP